MSQRPRYEPPLVLSDRFPSALAREQDQVPIVFEEWSALRFEESTPVASLDLGGIGLAVLCGDTGLAGDLGRLWRDFVVSELDDPVRLSIRVVDRQLFETPLGFVASEERDGEILAKLRGVSGRFDLSRRRVAVLVERGQVTQNLSNLLRMCLWAFAPSSDRFLVHAAAVEVAGEAVLVVGAAQSGKSTLVRLAAPRSVLSDDAVLVGLENARLIAATVGLWGIEGSAGIATPRVARRLPVRGLIALKKSTRAGITRLRSGRAALELSCALSLLTKQSATRRRSLAMVEAGVRGLTALEVAFAPDDAAVWSRIERELE